MNKFVRWLKFRPVMFKLELDAFFVYVGRWSIQFYWPRLLLNEGRDYMYGISWRSGIFIRYKAMAIVLAIGIGVAHDWCTNPFRKGEDERDQREADKERELLFVKRGLSNEQTIRV